LYKGIKQLKEIFMVELDKEEVKARYEAGENLREIASSLGVLTQSVREVLIDMGFNLKMRRGLKATNIEAIKADFENGVPLEEIAEKNSISQATLRNRLKLCGINSVVRKMPLPPKDLLISELENEGGLKGLHEKYGRTYAQLRREVLALGIQPKGSLRSPHRHFDHLPLKDEDVVRDYLSGMSSRKIAKKYGTSYQTICNRLERANVQRRPKGGPSLIHEHKEQVLKAHSEGLSNQAIAKKLGLSPPSVSKIITSEGLKANGVASLNLDVEYLWSLYSQGMLLREISEEVGVCSMTIRRHLLNAGYTLRPRGTKKKDSP
jgi:transposase